METGQSVDDEGRLVCRISGEVRRKHYEKIRRFIDLARTMCAEESIYSGKAIEVDF